MNKTVLTLFLFLICNCMFSQSISKTLNEHQFEFVQTAFNDTLQGEFIEIYRNGKKIITHTLSHSDGDCSSENLELGSYKIIDNNIVFYTYWASGDRMMKNRFPFGFRKQIYAVAKDGKVSQLSSTMYIETYVDSYALHEGMKFLKEKPRTLTEHKLLKEYISKAAKQYSANFTLNRKVLEKEVRDVLKVEIEENTKYWKEVYGDNCNM